MIEKDMIRKCKMKGCEKEAKDCSEFCFDHCLETLYRGKKKRSGWY